LSIVNEHLGDKLVDRARKATEISGISDRFSRARAAFLVDYKGMDVEQVTNLRKGLHPLNAEMKVVRNTLTKIALKDHPKEEEALSDKMVGTNAVVFAFEDPVAPAKFLSDFSKEVDKLQMKFGVLAGDPLDEGKIKYLATLPSKDELRAKFLGTLQAPAQKFVPASNFARLLAAYKDTKGA